MGLLFTIAAGPRQRSHSQVRVLAGLMPTFYCVRLSLPEAGGPGPRIYIPPEQVDPVISPTLGRTA
jgi:hypothetical protein